jgi:hypothetical protein
MDTQDLFGRALAAVAMFTLRLHQYSGVPYAFAGAAMHGNGSAVWRDAEYGHVDLHSAANELESIGHEVVAVLKERMTFGHVYGEQHMFRLGHRNTIFRTANEVDGTKEGRYCAGHDLYDHPSLIATPIDWVILFIELPAILGKIEAEAAAAT